MATCSTPVASNRSILLWEKEETANYTAVAGALRGAPGGLLCLARGVGGERVRGSDGEGLEEAGKKTKGNRNKYKQV